MRSIDDWDTVEGPAPPEGTASGLCLMISTDSLVRTHPLPESGDVTIGRGSGNAIRVDHSSVSRRHAVLHLGAEPDGPEAIEIEDLGSANGVRVQDRVLPSGGRARVSVGQVIELGDVIAVVRRAATAVRPRRLWPHGYFEGRLEEQCAQATRSGKGFAVVRLSVVAPPPPGTLEAAFGTALTTVDVLAEYAPHEYELLLPERTSDAEPIARRLASLIEQAGGRVRVGLALHPRDGTTPGALLACACDAVRALPVTDEGTLPRASAAMRRIHALAHKVSTGDLGVLILGETGVGKEVLAETIHRLSPRHNRPFVKLNCAAFADSLLESELFGHEKGAFTGAQRTKPGLFETAAGGTVLLDEVGELPMTTQVKLLRVLEDRKVLRIGALTPRLIDVRFLAATNRDLDVEVAHGRFRRDLYYRLNGVSLTIPPLRERPEEIEPLARIFIREACLRLGRAEPALSHEALERLRAYSWPGNIRELRNTIERAVLLCGAGPIGVADLPTEKMATTLLSAASPGADEPAAPPVTPGMLDANETTHRVPRTSADVARLAAEVDALERQRILEALERCAGNQTRAARLLGISRGKLVARLDAYGIPRPRK